MGTVLFSRPQAGQPDVLLVWIGRTQSMPISWGLAIEALISWHSTWIRRFVAPWVEINFYHSKDTKQMPNRAGIPYQHWKWVYQHLQGTPSQKHRFWVWDCLPKILLMILAWKSHSKKDVHPKGYVRIPCFPAANSASYPNRPLEISQHWP